MKKSEVNHDRHEAQNQILKRPANERILTEEEIQIAVHFWDSVQENEDRQYSVEMEMSVLPFKKMKLPDNT